MAIRQNNQQMEESNEIFIRRLSLIVQQMGSEDPSVRKYALQSLDQMVTYEVLGEKKEHIQTPINEIKHQEEDTLTRSDADVIYKIRLLQKEKEKQTKKRKPFLFF